MSVRRASSLQMRLRNGKLALAVAAAIGTAGTGVTVTEYAVDMTVLQHVGGYKTITLNGTTSGNPSELEYRLVDWYSGVPRTSWASLILNPGNVWSKQLALALTPYGGMDTIQVRDKWDTSLTSTTINRLGVGEIVLCIGQSNMVNARTTANGVYPNGGKSSFEYGTAPVARVRVGNYKDSFPANTAFATYGAGYTTTQTNADGWVYLANNLAIGLGCPVMLVNRAVGGTRIESWFTGQTNWSGTVSGVPGVVLTMTALGGDWATTIWLQAESNAIDTSTATQSTSIRTIKSQTLALNGRTNSTHKFVIVSLGAGSYLGSTEGQFGNMRAAQVAVAADAGCLLGAAAHACQTGDGVHWNGAAHSQVWRQVAQSIVFAWKGTGNNTSGPKVASASRIAAQVKVAITHVGGTSLMDGAGGTAGTGLTGFEYKDNGSVIAVSSTAISGAAEITLNLASIPSGIGPQTLSYGMMNAPHNVGGVSTGALVPASIPCDNATYYGSGAIGCVLNPCAAITVT